MSTQERKTIRKDPTGYDDLIDERLELLDTIEALVKQEVDRRLPTKAKPPRGGSGKAASCLRRLYRWIEKRI